MGQSSLKGVFVIFPLSSLLILFVILAWTFKGLVLYLFDSTPLMMTLDGKEFYLPLGEMSLSLPLLAFSFVFLNLFNEFYDKKSALMSTASAGLSLFCLAFALYMIPQIPILEDHENLQIWIQAFFDLSPENLTADVSAVFLGFGIASLTFTLMRKITHNSFSGFRAMVASFFGGSVLILISGLFTHSLSKTDFWPPMITSLVQWSALSIVIMIVFMIFKFPLKFFVKKEIEKETQENYNKASLFRPNEDKDFFESVENNHETKIPREG